MPNPTIKTTSQNTPSLRFPGFSDPWIEKKLGKLSDVRDGTHDSPKYHLEGYPLITSKNLQIDGSIDFHNVNLITIEDFNNINKRSKVDLGDILFGMIGTIGHPVIVRNDNFAIKNVALIKEKQQLLNQYLFQYLKSIYIDKKFYKKNAGGTQKFIALGLIRDLVIPTPGLSEQQKIASFLSAIDTWLDNLRSQKSSLKSYKKSIMQKIFSQEIRFKDENGKNYPEWENLTLDELGIFLKGKGISKDDVTPDGTHKCVRYGELYTDYKEIIVDIKSRTNAKHKDSMQSKKNDLLIPSSGETAIDIATASHISEEGVLLGGDLIIIRLNESSSGSFFAYYLTHQYKKRIAKLAQGNAVVHLYASQLKKLLIKVPSYPEQKKIADIFISLDKNIESKHSQITDIEDWKKGLMQRMFI